MFLELNDQVEVGGISKRGKTQWVDENNAIVFSMTVLTSLLHKYSSREFEDVHLKIREVHAPQRIAELRYFIKSDQSFLSLFKLIENDFQKTFTTIDSSLDIEWVTGKGEIGLKNRIRLSVRENQKLCDIVFSSDPHSPFHHVFKNASRHFKTLAANAEALPGVLIDELEYMVKNDAVEIDSVAYGPRDHFVAVPQFLDEIFEETADAYPNYHAVVHHEKPITYFGLNKKANQLANVLMDKGVQRGDVVGILLTRSIEAYSAMLAILKCGAAYVPIDIDYPCERVDYILEDSSAKYLITHTKFDSHFSVFSGRVLNVDQELMTAFSDPVNEMPNYFELIQRSTEDACYIIYTSGTTGKPKGVVISHAAASNLVKAERLMFKVKPTDKVGQGFSIAFDASIEEIWLAFSTGAALYPIDHEVMCSPADLCEFLEQQKITVFSTVPTLLSIMPIQLSSLRLLILGGELCSYDLLQRWKNNKLRIVNTYGPTEATVIATASDFNLEKKLTIGKPIANCAVFITDSSLRPVPIGVAGELCIGGRGLATRYQNNDERTSEKFVEPPFKLREDFPQRIYRSGDLARFNEDGDIEFLGRIDTQVKLRGYRIELSEIESQIRLLPNIKNAVVALKENAQRGSSLIAYIVRKDKSQSLKPSSLKYSLRKKLASYMIPSIFREIDEVPMLPSGKVDRKRLLHLPLNATALDGKTREALSVIEQSICNVWQEYFSDQTISKRDDFFLDLGGHSLLAAKTVSELRLQSKFKEVSVVDIYKNPTIEKLARQLASRKNYKSRETVTISPERKNYSSKIRHFFCGLFQFFSFYLVFGVNVIRDFSLYAVFFYLYQNDHTWESSVAWALAASVASYPVMIAFTIMAKWILLGKIKAGRYRLWGGFYLRWWLVRKLFQLLDLYHFAGTPLLPMVYRALGMKVGKDVHIETDHFDAFDLISIGDGASIDEEAMLNGFSVQNGFLVIAPITIGKNCFVGTRSVVSENTVMEDNSRIEDLSLIPAGTRIPSGETWSGSPARCLSKINTTEVVQRPSYTRGYRIAVSVLYAALTCVIPIISAIAFAPGIVLLMQHNPLEEFWTYISLLPVVGFSFVLLLTAQVVVFKWILVGRVKPGIYPVHGGFYIRHWIVDQLLRSSLDHVGQLHATLHVANWYRALGMKIGPHVELSTAASATPDLIHLEEGCTIADEASLGSPHVEKGWMTVAPVHMGYRSFAGNSAVIPAGVTVGDHSLIGVLSITPKSEEAVRTHATWFGSPAILFPKREQSIDYKEERTYKPSKKLRMMRGTFELLRITLPPAAFILIAASVITTGLKLWQSVGGIPALLLLPAVFGVAAALTVLMVALFKWIVIGRYKPFSKPLWGNFVWRLELINSLYEFFAAPLLLDLLRGTPFLAWFLRCLGSRIGSECYIDTTGFLEWDMVEVGDRTVINENAVIQSHLFEDRVLKSSKVSIGEDCNIGVTSVVLYDSVMKDGSKLDSLSLVMKGEVLPERTHWIGIPAASKTVGPETEDEKRRAEIINDEQHELESAFAGENV